MILRDLTDSMAIIWRESGKDSEKISSSLKWAVFSHHSQQPMFTRYKYGKAIFSKSRNENFAIACDLEIVLIVTIRTTPRPSKADINAVIWEFTKSFFIFRSCDLELSGVIGSMLLWSWTGLNWLKLDLIRLIIKDLNMICILICWNKK